MHLRYHKARLSLQNVWFRLSEGSVGASHPTLKVVFYVPLMSRFHSFLHNFNRLDRSLAIDEFLITLCEAYKVFGKSKLHI